VKKWVVMDDDGFWRPTRGEAVLARFLGGGAGREAGARPPATARSLGPRRRLVAGAVVVLALAALWAALAAGSPRRAVRRPVIRPATTGVTTTTDPGERVLAAVAPALRERCTLRALVARCRARGAVATVEYARFGDPLALSAAYRDVVGAPVGGRGASHCARGRPEERAWARRDAPSRVAGRYRCAVVAGVASMWWTDTDTLVLAHATGARAATLAAVYAWWARLDGGA
jgi:hypothetical protein